MGGNDRLHDSPVFAEERHGESCSLRLDCSNCGRLDAVSGRCLGSVGGAAAGESLSGSGEGRLRAKVTVEEQGPLRLVIGAWVCAR